MKSNNITAPPTSPTTSPGRARSVPTAGMKVKLRPRDRCSRSRLSVKMGGIEKGPKKPKRPKNAYLLFMEGFRKDYKEAHPDNKVLATVSRAGKKKWRTLTDAEKAPHEAKANKLMDEYNKNTDAYYKCHPKPPYIRKAKKWKADSKSYGDSRRSVKKCKAEKGPNKPKRPQTAFFLFMTIEKKNGKVKKQSACQSAGAGAAAWNALDDDGKKPYVVEAEILMAQYKEEVRVYKSWQARGLDALGDMEAGGPEGGRGGGKARRHHGLA